MAFTETEKKEIETLVRKEIKDFIGTTTVKQFEDKLLNIVIQDMKRGKTEKEIKDLVIKMFTEFYGMMYQQRSMWQGRLRNA
jgi:uncharacterized protein (UPF0335 family)